MTSGQLEMDSIQKQRTELVRACRAFPPSASAFRLPGPAPSPIYFPPIISRILMQGMPSDWHCGHIIPLTIKGRRMLVCCYV